MPDISLDTLYAVTPEGKGPLVCSQRQDPEEPSTSHEKIGGSFELVSLVQLGVVALAFSAQRSQSGTVSKMLL
jgi:hypothetical protein